VQDEIIRVAALCFGEMGYRATTLDTIAARAGLSKVTLYHHVSSKEDLLCRVFERTIESLRSGLRRIVAAPVPVDEKLRRIVRYQVTLLATHRPFLAVFFSEEGGLPPPMARRVAREKRAWDRTIEGVVREGIGRGVVRGLDPTLLVFAIDGMCNWLAKWYRPDGRCSPEEIADTFVDLLEHGYLTAAAASDPTLHRIARSLATLERRLRPAASGRDLDRDGERPAGAAVAGRGRRPARGRQARVSARHR
jgi:AcrR family transcriptional regulator